MGFISTSFHFMFMVQFIYVIHYDLVYLEPDYKYTEINKIGLGRLKYLTFWNMLVQCVYYILAYANDLFGTNAKSSKRQSDLQKWRDFIFTTIGFSLSTFVCVAFWVLYAINRELILPVEVDDWFPSWMNHGQHSVPMIGVFIEVWLVYHKFPKQHIGFMTMAMFNMLYGLWICFIAYYWDGFWVYPILKNLPMFGRAIFIAVSSLALGAFYFLGEHLHNLAWGSRKTKNKTY